MAEDPNAEAELDVASLSFEQAFERLGKLAESLDSGGLTLADATARYEQGMVLVRRCNQLLDAAELKITNLKDAYSEEVNGQDGQGSKDQSSEDQDADDETDGGSSQNQLSF
ncbi:MAG: exodeoxyribonuclease VII small subunit [SAR202 cluster bacterium Io17-Chloro-G9]|nr:MAG: exodeoxyribonuclease VII small subunit [SAR202 cluster bacterium Io17-Chloro-G9]